MVGHTGDLSAAMAACASVDMALAQVVGALENVGGAMIICADHGNCETMIDPKTGGPHTAHTTNPVPVILVGAATRIARRWPVGGFGTNIVAIDGPRYPR